MDDGPTLIEDGLIIPKPNNYIEHVNKISTRYNIKFVSNEVWL